MVIQYKIRLFNMHPIAPITTVERSQVVTYYVQSMTEVYRTVNRYKKNSILYTELKSTKRIFRLMRLAKLTRYNDSLKIVVRTLRNGSKPFEKNLIEDMLQTFSFRHILLTCSLEPVSKMTNMTC